jgi:hypothetical protein
MSTLKKLTENIVAKNLRNENKPLLNKWSKTGLLEGLGEQGRTTMSRLLENQAKELLREATTMEAGDVEGFAAVAFPIVRRVFGGLLAQDLVSVQPMSLPSGLIFFMDFVRNAARGPFAASESIYGGDQVAKGIASGVHITGSAAESGFYNLSAGYSMATGSGTVASASFTQADMITLSTGSENLTDAEKKVIEFDPDLLADGDAAYDASTNLYCYKITVAGASLGSEWAQVSRDHLMALNVATLSGSNSHLIRRRTTYDGTTLTFFVTKTNTGSPVGASGLTVTFPVSDNLTTGGALGAVVGATSWPLEAEADIPEINIKVDSIAITAQTRKLKSVWTPELSQDMNAYHNLDAEVELTGILSESIALEVDQEILHDLIKGATAATLYWSRRPGMFVNRLTGADLTNNGAGLPDFTGNVSEWYETLLETVNDVSADIHRKVLRGGATFLVCGPEIANILEMTSGFRADVTGDADKGSAGTYKSGSISKKWDLYVDPYFPRNVILVGRKGTGFLESGYVYAPYVPLQVTPVIFDPDDFTPRRGVATRYGKKMVRPDMYGLVIVRDLEG